MCSDNKQQDKCGYIGQTNKKVCVVCGKHSSMCVCVGGLRAIEVCARVFDKGRFAHMGCQKRKGSVMATSFRGRKIQRLGCSVVAP